MLNRYTKLSNVELIEKCKRDPIDERAWHEFYNRFHRVISRYVYKWSVYYKIGTNSQQGTNGIEDIKQSIFLKLSDDNRKAIKFFRNESENSIFAYLAKMIKYEVINNAKHDSAMKRKAHTISIHESAASSKDENNLEILDFLASSIDSLEYEQDYKDQLEAFRSFIGDKKE